MTRIYLAEIEKAACAHFGLSQRHMTHPRRWPEFVVPRQIAMYLARKHTKLTQKQIGMRFNKDHSTVHDAVRKITAQRELDAALASSIRAIEKALGV